MAVLQNIVNYQDLNHIVEVLDTLSSTYQHVPVENIDRLHSQAKDILWPLSYYVQRASPQNITKMAVAMSQREEVLEKLSEGILRRFVDELKIKSKVNSQEFLRVVLALETLFMEWSCDLMMQEALIRVGIVYLLFQQLKLFYRSIYSNREINKYILAPALTIGNCAETGMDLYMRLHGNTAILDILVPYFVSSNSLISSCTKFIRNNFSWYLHNAHPGSVDCPDHIGELLEHLFQSLSPTPLTATAFSVEPSEILNMFRQLNVSPKNRTILLEHSKLQEIMSHLLQGPQEENTIFGALNLLLSFLSPFSIPKLAKVHKPKGKHDLTSPVKKDINHASVLLMKSLPHLTSWLTNLDFKSSKLQELRDAVLHILGIETVSSIHSMLKCCYDYKHYELVIQLAKSGDNDENCTSFEMKARYQLYCRDQIILQQKEKELPVSDLLNARKKLYSEARKIVQFFVRKENEEMKEMLDNMLMDIVRDLNEKSGIRSENHGRSYFNCVLCHKPDAIVKGHFWAKSHILAIRGKEKKYIKDRASLHRKPDLKEVSKIIYYMFCINCDNNLLSIDEKFFAETIALIVYPQPNTPIPAQEHRIVYKGASLYRFCLGMAFRGLILQKSINNYTNSATVYKVFQQIRKILLSDKDEECFSDDFPVVLMFYTPAKVPLNEPETIPMLDETIVVPVISDDTSQFLPSTPKLTRNALMVEEDLKSTSNSSKILDVPAYIDGSDFSRVSYVSLYSDMPTNRRKAHFMLLKHGIFNIVTLLEQSEIQPEHQQFVISPVGGTLYIPANELRMDFLPPGLTQAYKERVPHFLRDLLESDSKVSSLHSLQHISKMMAIPSAPIVSVHNNILEYNINLLPVKYNIDRTSNKLHLPSNHKILLHHTQYGQTTNTGETVFLIIDNNEWSHPYAIVHKFAPNMAISIGYYVSSENFSFVERLKSENHKGMELLVQEKDSMLELAARMLPIALLNAGLTDFGSLILCHQSGFVMDRKCVSGYGCWYCSLSCEVCRASHVYGSPIKSMDDILFKFCSQDCLDLYDNYFDDTKEHPIAKLVDIVSVKEIPDIKEVTPENKMPISDKQDKEDLAQKVMEDKQERNECIEEKRVPFPTVQDMPLDETVVEIETQNCNESEDQVIEKPKQCDTANLESLTCHEIQLSNAVLLMLISGNCQQADGTPLRITMKLFHSPQDIMHVPILHDTFFVICLLQLVDEQYLDVYYVSLKGSLCEQVYTKDKDSQSDYLPLSDRKQLLCDVLHDGLCKHKVESLSSLL